MQKKYWEGRITKKWPLLTKLLNAASAKKQRILSTIHSNKMTGGLFHRTHRHATGSPGRLRSVNNFSGAARAVHKQLLYRFTNGEKSLAGAQRVVRRE